MLRRMLLEHHGFKPQCASNAEIALVIARESRPGVAVVDLRLPTEEQGWQLISRLKQTVPSVCIVVLSGLPRAASDAHPAQTLVHAWITKGGGARVLIDTLNGLAA